MTSNNIMNKSDVAEVVFVPMPGIGHLLAIVEMAKIILQRDQRISITVYLINRDVPKINAYIKSELRENLFSTRLTFITLPTLDPLDPSTPNFFSVLTDLYKPLLKQAVLDRVNLGSPKPVGFVLDMFCTAMIDVANELCVPSYIFFTSGANFLNLMFYAQSLVDYQGVDVATEFNNSLAAFNIPGFKNPVTSNVIPALLQNESSCRVNANHSRRYRETKGILVNTFLDLETFPLETLLDVISKDVEEKLPPIYPVGPIIRLECESREGDIHDEGYRESDLVVKWLNDQPESSVVFLCFGSMGYFDADQVKEIARGLEDSSHRFLWSLRKPPLDGRVRGPPRGPPRNDIETFVEALPEGFLDRTAHKGKVIGWASQVSILAHRAIGGFVSHCGWNSILESMWFGVPIATWPIHSEQQLNAFELVKELELAVEIRMDFAQDWKTGKANTIIKAEEITKGVEKLMCIDEITKQRIREMRENSRKAIQFGGSSYNSLSSFIRDLFDNVVYSS